MIRLRYIVALFMLRCADAAAIILPPHYAMPLLRCRLPDAAAAAVITPADAAAAIFRLLITLPLFATFSIAAAMPFADAAEMPPCR